MEVKYAIAAFCFWFFAFVNRYLNGIIILYSVVGSCVRYIQCECSILVFGLSTAQYVYTYYKSTSRYTSRCECIFFLSIRVFQSLFLITVSRFKTEMSIVYEPFFSFIFIYISSSSSLFLILLYAHQTVMMMGNCILIFWYKSCRHFWFQYHSVLYFTKD